MGISCTSSEDSSPADSTEITTSEPGATSEPGETSAPTALALVDTGVDVEAPMDAHPFEGSLLVAERAGKVVELTATDDGSYDVAGTVVDLTDQVGSTDVEKGLLGLTTDEAGNHLYVNHTRAADGATVVVEFPLTGEPGSLRAGDPRELLTIDQPFPNHNGGDLAWGPDEMLWLGTGDGGAGGDPDGRAQRLTDPLGKILRLDPSLDGSGVALAPPGNPYADGVDTNGTDGTNGTSSAAGAGDAPNPLIWARGVRNPWRISFDSGTGDLWIGDVGQDRFEEIDVLRSADGLDPGSNLGWDRFEGNEPFADPGPTEGWPNDDAALIKPLFSYEHSPGCSISGGFVYRGSTLAQFQGHYLFSDYCDGRIRSATQKGDAVDLDLESTGVVSINPDENGEPLVLDAEGIKRIQPR